MHYITCICCHFKIAVSRENEFTSFISSFVTTNVDLVNIDVYYILSSNKGIFE